LPTAPRLTPRRIVLILRVCAVVCGLGLAVLMLGPFQGLEQVFGLGDKPAHAIAFFCVSTGLFAILPNWRRGDIALAVLGVAVLSEVLQALTGRSLSVTDLMADATGVLIALVPGWVERLRHLVRAFPDAGFAEIRAADRRQGRATEESLEPVLDVARLAPSPVIRPRHRRKAPR
jgi:VanZ family protein